MYSVVYILYMPEALNWFSFCMCRQVPPDCNSNSDKLDWTEEELRCKGFWDGGGINAVLKFLVSLQLKSESQFFPQASSVAHQLTSANP